MFDDSAWGPDATPGPDEMQGMEAPLPKPSNGIKMIYNTCISHFQRLAEDPNDTEARHQIKVAQNTIVRIHEQNGLEEDK
jgi:hypothetical protein